MIRRDLSGRIGRYERRPRAGATQLRAAGPASFGRVDPDGTVWVRTAAGERSVGQVPDVPAEEALAFFTRRYEALELEVVPAGPPDPSGALSPDDAPSSIRTVRADADRRARRR